MMSALSQKGNARNPGRSSTRRAWTGKQKQGFKKMLMIMPFMVMVAVLSYYPLHGWIYAFYDYKPPRPLSKCEFVGLQWFISLVENETKRKQIFEVLRNTFAMSGLSILTSWLPMIFAVFLNELKSNRYKKAVQTLTTIPNFISWVLIYSLAYSLFSSTGMVNTLLTKMGIISEPILFLQSSKHTWLSMWAWGTWKSLGWSAIMYMAAIAGIDQEQYEAARVDGATRFQMIRYITIPNLLPTYFVLLVLNIANFLNNGMEQYFVFQNAFNSDTIQVLDLYVYNLGMKAGNYSLATAVSILKSVVSIALLTTVNKLSKAIRGESVV